MLPYLFVLLAIGARFLNLSSHVWHVTPLAASLLYFGARGSRRQMWIPLALLAATDVVLTKLVYTSTLGWDQLVTWAWYAAILWMGTGLREKSTFWRVAGAALASSVSFFVVSNFAVWAAWDMYPHNWSGLMTSYTMAIPFFRGTLASDLFFSAAFFGLPVLVQSLVERSHGGQAAA